MPEIGSDLQEEFPPLLPPGLHRLTIQQLRAICADRFAGKALARRADLMLRLAALHETLTGSGVRGELWIAGSMLSEKPEPGDIDAVIVADAISLDAIPQSRQAHVEALLIDGEAFARYSCDLYFCLSDDTERVAYWRGWFGTSRQGVAKGVAVISL